LEARKIQQVSVSTFIVSLPRDWSVETGLKKGDIVYIKREDDGSLRIYPSKMAEEKPVKCIIKSDLCEGEGMLTRVLTGNYLLGHDTMEVEANKEIHPRHFEEIRNTVKQLTGLGVVEQTLKKVILQSFVDSTKFPIYGLISRLHVIVSSMQEATVRALLERRPELAQEALHMEVEADRIYWLIIRQLLTAMRKPELAKKIGIESPTHISGNRVIAVCLERIGDFVETMAYGVLQLLERGLTESRLLEEIREYNEVIKGISDKIFRAFFTKDMALANDVIETVEVSVKGEKRLTEKIAGNFAEMRKRGVSDPCLVCLNLSQIVGNLIQISTYYKTIAEVTINRILEEPTKICSFKSV
jgi:phosphate uptake regulator